MELDDLDRRLLAALAGACRPGVLQLARELGVARNTVQARLDRLVARGVVTGFGPEVHLERFGYSVLAFVTLEIAQGRIDAVLDHLAAVDEITEVAMVTGEGDLLCRVVARTNEHLGVVLTRILEIPGLSRTSTALALSTPIPHRTAQLLA